MAESEKKLLIKRTDSAVEITVGERDSPDNKEPVEGLPDEEDKESCPDCFKTIDTTCCFRPLTKLQLCILAIIAIVALILALFVIVILVGVIASHSQRLRDLEIKTEVLEASNAKLNVLVKNISRNETEFKREMRMTIEEAMNQFNIIYIQTLSLLSLRDQLESKVDQLVNRTDVFEVRLEELTSQVHTLKSESSSPPPPSISQPPPTSKELAIEEDTQNGVTDYVQDLEIGKNCDVVCGSQSIVLCLRFTERSNFLCARPMSLEKFEEMKYRYLEVLQLEYHCHCVDG